MKETINTKRVICFGAGDRGRQLCKMLCNPVLRKSLGDIEIRFFSDNAVKEHDYDVVPIEKYIEGIKIISPDEINQCHDIDGIIITTSKIVDEAAKQLKDLEIKIPVYLVPDYVYEYKWSEQMPPFVLIDITKPRMPYLECRIVEHCNLNCKGCGGVSNICEEHFVDIDNYEKDLKALKGLFSGIKQFHLLGGEPLLHPELEDFIIKTRMYFPDSKIVVHSNGLLVPKLAQKVLDAMNKYAVDFLFTLYPVTGKIKRRIENRLNAAAVKYVFTSPVYEFRKIINIKGDYDPKEIYKMCAKCINLIDGTLSCGMGKVMQIIENKFHVSICEDKGQHCIDIHTTEYDGWQINEILDSPFNLCAYCSEPNSCEDNEQNVFLWSCGTTPSLDEFIVQ